MNENKDIALSEVYEKIMGLERQDYAAPAEKADGYQIVKKVTPTITGGTEMSTTTTIARGSQYSRESIYDPCNWGDVTDEQADTLGDEVVRQFDERANARLPYASLIVSTSEVYGYADADYPDDTHQILHDCLGESFEYVMEHLDALIGEDA